MTPQTATILFIIINIAVFFIATIISFEGSHRNHEEFKSKQQRYKDALKNLRKESAEAALAARRLRYTNVNMETKKHQRSKMHEKFAEESKILKDNYEWLIRSYRTANMSVRSSALLPVCFKNNPKELLIPENLLPENLDWDCHSNDKSNHNEKTITYPN